MASPKLRVAICGGGIGGLVSAIAISQLSSEQKDIQIDLYESARAFFEIGAGIGIFLRPWLILRDIGLESALKPFTKAQIEEDKTPLTWQIRKSDKPEGRPLHDLHIPGGTATFYRVELQNALVSMLDPQITRTHFSRRMKSYTLPPPSEPTSPITLHFEDGSTATCDVLLGADGIHSVTRKILLNLAASDAEKSGTKDAQETADALRGVIDSVWTGAMMYREVIPREMLEKMNPNHSVLKCNQMFWGKRGTIIAYLVSNGRLVNLAASHLYPEKEGTYIEGEMVRDVPQEELLAHFEGWEEDASQLCQCMGKPSRWAVKGLNDLPICTHNRVALLGDAAHAMSPYQGAGAGQAIEDAYVLAALLTHPLTTVATLPTALKIYESIRLPYANKVKKASRDNGFISMFSDPRFDDVDGHRTEEETEKTLQEMVDAVVQNWEWSWTTNPTMTRKEAVDMLEEQLADH